MFTSRNEIEQFSFEDCQISEFKLMDSETGKSDIHMKLEALIVGERNSQNSNYTRSYADTTDVVFKDATIHSVILSGYKVYDANDNLIEEVEDKELPKEQWMDAFSKFNNAYLYRVVKITDEIECTYELEIEECEDVQFQDLRDDAFIVKVSFQESEFKWARYLNKVSNI